MLQENEFGNIFARGTNLPKIDTIRDTVKVVERAGLKAILQHKVKKAIKNKVYASGTIDGYIVGAIDGTKFFGSSKKTITVVSRQSNERFTHWTRSKSGIMKRDLSESACLNQLS